MEYITDAWEAGEIDRLTMEEIGIPSAVLMERAAMAVADEIMRRFPDEKKEKIAVVCGSGNNGGDGVAAARILAERGYAVSVQSLGRQEKWSEELASQMHIAEQLGMSVGSKIDFSEYTVIVDAIFGIGLSREVTGIYRTCIEQINHSEAFVVAVDIPSGIDASTGAVHGEAVRADLTVTFGTNKRGNVLYPGCTYSGEVETADIGFPQKAVSDTAPAAYTFDGEEIARQMPLRAGRTNKGNYGRVLVLAGSPGMSGACFFSAKAAYRMGCGLVKIMTSADNLPILKGKLPEAIFGCYEEEDALVSSLAWADVIVFGPGIGMSERARNMLDLVLLEAKSKGTVIDADGLNLLAEREDWKERLSENVVLTPHLLEMSRLAKIPVSEIQSDLIGMAVSFGSGHTLVLKDARTIVSGGSTHAAYINMTGNNALATGGSGDVLSGMIAGLMAQGMKPREAADLAVCIHGLTAESYAAQNSRYSMMATDILEEPPRVLPW